MKRKLVVASTGTLCVLVIATGVLWIWKPWLPPLELAEPGPHGRRIDERGVFANFYRAEGNSRGSILLIGGSEGGIATSEVRTAVALQEHGYNVLVASYFGAPGQPKNLERVPLETFDLALDWLASQPGTRADRMAVMGTSKGAEAALLIGVRHPELRAVIGAAPSSAVWPGINFDTLNGLNADSSWTVDGKPLPYLPYGRFQLSLLTGDVGSLYKNAVHRLADHPDAAIPIEDIHARVLLVCGDRDRLWPSCPMARQLQHRAAAAGRPDVVVLERKRVGHADLSPPYPDDGPKPRWGGTAHDTNKARALTWETLVRFLETNLAKA